MFTCRSMRAAVLLSASLLGAGVLLGLLAVLTHLGAAAAQLALLLVLGGATVLATTFVVALIPGVARRLDECQH